MIDKLYFYPPQLPAVGGGREQNHHRQFLNGETGEYFKALYHPYVIDLS